MGGALPPLFFMKKIVILTLFILSSLTQLYAGTSGSLSVSGIITVINDLSTSPYSKATDLNITSGETGTLIADIVELSNNPDGYNIQLTSQNAGKLINTSNTSYQVSYQLSYNNGSYINLSTTPVTAKSIYFLNQKTSSVSPVKIKFSGLSSASSGSYEDVITLSIVAN